MPPPSLLGRSTLGARHSWWQRFFGTAGPESPTSVGSIRVAPDDPSIRQRYTGTVLARAPLRELGPAAVSRVADLQGTRRVDEVRFALGVSRSNRRADRLGSILDSARAARTKVAPIASVATEATRFAGAFHWALSIPGTHYSGLTNQHLLEIMEANGRPFASDTPQLRDHVRARLLAAFASADWERSRAVDIAARAVREWIVRRLDEQGLDVELKPLNADYAHWKQAHGYSSQIGRKTGAWRGSLANAVVEVIGT